MELPKSLKIEIQTFVYFLFKGSLTPELINAEYDYLDLLIRDRKSLYNCFKIFAYYQSLGETDIHKAVGVYIQALHKDYGKETVLNFESALSTEHKTFWKEFLNLSYCFCFNDFPDKINNDYVVNLNGCGSDAVPAFAIFTNIIEVNTDLKALNPQYVLKRVNEYLIQINNNIQPQSPFTNRELEQELY